MITQTTSVDIRWFEVMTKGEHGQQGCVARLVAEVVTELSASKFRTAVGLGSNKLGVLAVLQVVTHEGERDTAEVTASAEAAYDDVGVFARHLHLLLSLKTYYRLVQSYVVEHRAQGVFAVWSCCGKLYRLADSCSERTGMQRVAGEDVLAGAG